MKRISVLLLLLASLVVTATVFAAPPGPGGPGGPGPKPGPGPKAPPGGPSVYNNIPSPQPGNVVSQSFEATSTSEFGGQIQLAGTNNANPVFTVLMSSWGCQTGSWFAGNCSTTPGTTFSEPITLNVYSVGAGGSVGSLIATTTQTFTIPYRPSASATCTGGRWSDGTTCFNGYATPVVFNSLAGVTLPDQTIVSVAYNTSDYGSKPYGDATACHASSGGCGYDSLNVGLASPPSVGSDPQPDDAYLNSSYGGSYCDGGSGGTGTFRLDAGCWTGYQPAIKVTAAPAHLTLDKQAISDKQCAPGGSHAKQLVDVTYTLFNDADSGFGGNDWANDTLNRHLKIWQEQDGTFCAQIADTGKFVTIAGVSPSGFSTVSDGITGNIDGGYVTNDFTATLNPTPGYATHGNLGSFDANGTHPSFLSYFNNPDSVGWSQPGWGWLYKADGNGTWLNQNGVPAESSGDITS